MIAPWLPIAWVDAAFLAVLLLSAAVGAWRGAVFELLALLGWVVAFIAAQAFAAELAPHLPIGSRGGPLNLAAAFVLLLVGVRMVWGLGAHIVRWLVRASPLSSLDRLLGAVFGLARGVLVLMVVATLVSLTPATGHPQWRASAGAGWLREALRGIAPLLPPDFARHLPA